MKCSDTRKHKSVVLTFHRAGDSVDYQFGYSGLSHMLEHIYVDSSSQYYTNGITTATKITFIVSSNDEKADIVDMVDFIHSWFFDKHGNFKDKIKDHNISDRINELNNETYLFSLRGLSSDDVLESIRFNKQIMYSKFTGDLDPASVKIALTNLSNYLMNSPCYSVTCLTPNEPSQSEKKKILSILRNGFTDIKIHTRSLEANRPQKITIEHPRQIHSYYGVDDKRHLFIRINTPFLYFQVPNIQSILNDYLQIEYFNFCSSIPFVETPDDLFLHVTYCDEIHNGLNGITAAMRRLSVLNIMDIPESNYSMAFFETRHNEGFYVNWIDTNVIQYYVLISCPTSSLFEPPQLFVSKDYNPDMTNYERPFDKKRIKRFNWIRSLHYEEISKEYSSTSLVTNDVGSISIDFPLTLRNIVAAKYYEQMYVGLMYVTRNAIHVSKSYEKEVVQNILSNEISLSQIFMDKFNLVFFIMSMRVYELVEGYSGLVNLMIDLLYREEYISLSLIQENLIDDVPEKTCKYSSDLFFYDYPFSHFVFITDIAFPSYARTRLIRQELKRSGVLYVADTCVYKNRSVLYGLIL
jgi:hypothetical protein